MKDNILDWLYSYAIALLISTAFTVIIMAAAHAQRYDSSYGYEMRGFIPPDPVPRALRDYDNVRPTEPAQRQRRNKPEAQRSLSR